MKRVYHATALLISTIVFFVSLSNLKQAGDFTWGIKAAEFLIEGKNPYLYFPVTKDYPLNDYLYYPMPAILFSIPWIYLGKLAGPLFLAIPTYIIAFNTVKNEGFYSTLITFSSVSFASAVHYCQWSILLVAIPALWFVKPSIGLIAITKVKNWRIMAIGVLICIASLVFFPWWLGSWVYTVTHFKNHIHNIPIVLENLLIVPSLILLSEIHTLPLVLFLFMRQSIFYYDQFIFFSFFRNIREKLIYVSIEWAGFISIFYFNLEDIHYYILLTSFFPAYIILSFNVIKDRFIVKKENSYVKFVRLWKDFSKERFQKR